MQLRQILLPLLFSAGSLTVAFAQQCPAPNPGSPNCFQTTRPNNGNPALNHVPIPNQDCCNAIALCDPVNVIENGAVIPVNPQTTNGRWDFNTIFPGCVRDELPSDANTCFGNNEKGTTWYKFQIRPLPGRPNIPGTPAGKLRFKIVPQDVLDLPNYDPSTDDGTDDLGETDYDFLLFKIPTSAATDGAACGAIKNSTALPSPTSVVASCNYTATDGPTGLFEPGTGIDGAVPFSQRFNKPINVRVGDLFYLAIDNFSVNQQGFQVDFRGLEAPDDTTAIVTPAQLDSIKVSKLENPKCQSRDFTITFQYPVLCDSVRPDKFTILSPQVPDISITSMTAVGGCNPGGQDSSFNFRVTPFVPGTTLQIVLSKEIKDICGNNVLFDTANFAIDSLVPLTFKIDKQPSCGKPEITVKFAKPVYCDSVKARKWSILYKGEPYGQVTGTRRANNLAGGPGCLDTTFVIRFNKAIKDSLNFQLALNGVIRDFCGNPVVLDSLPFRIDPFLKIKADPLVVCPKKPVSMTARLDSIPFLGYRNDSLQFSWKNLNNNQPLVRDDSTFFAINPDLTDNERIVTVIRDLVYPEVVNYQLIVKHRLNGCVDTATVPIRFSARPDIEDPGILTYCFGETIAYKPTFTNAKPSELVYSWFRKSAADTISKDSVFTQLVDSALIARGLDQTYVLRTQYLDSLGGCPANALDVRIRYGKKITPKIVIDSIQRFASITPADFIFGNGSKFYPVKNGARYDWDFGKGFGAQNNTKTVNGTESVAATFPDPGSFNVRLTAYDTLLQSITQIGKVCKNTDSINVFVQNLIPSLVTSNGDNVNDNFYVKGMRENTFSMKLYNRWGKLVGEQDPFEINGWDPKDISPGNYYYILTEKRSGKTLVSWLTISRE